MQVGEGLDHASHVNASLSGLAHYLAGSTFISLFCTHTLLTFCGWWSTQMIVQVQTPVDFAGSVFVIATNLIAYLLTKE